MCAFVPERTEGWKPRVTSARSEGWQPSVALEELVAAEEDKARGASNGGDVSGLTHTSPMHSRLLPMPGWSHSMPPPVTPSNKRSDWVSGAAVATLLVQEAEAEEDGEPTGGEGEEIAEAAALDLEAALSCS